MSSAGSRSPSEREVFFAVIYYGFAVIFTQSCGLREFITYCHGSEFYIAVFLLFWLSSAAVGAFLAPRLLSSVRVEFILLPLFPFLGFLTFSSGALLFGRGVVQGLVPRFWEVFFLAAFEVVPPAFLSGILFVLLCRFLRAAKVYALEAAGITTGGILLDAALLPLFGNYFSLMLLASVGLLFEKGWKRNLTGTVFLILLLLTPSVERFIIERVEMGRVVAVEHTRAGRMSVRDVEGERCLFRDGAPVVADSVSGKVLVTLVEGVVGERGKVLLVSSNPAVLEDEVRSRGWDFVSFAADGAVAKVLRKFFGTNTEVYDVRTFLSETDERFTVALIEVGLPSSAADNRRMTVEFFEALSARCMDVVVAIPFVEGAPPTSYKMFLKAFLEAVEDGFGRVELHRIRGAGLIVTTLSPERLFLRPFGETSPLELRLLTREIERVKVGMNSDINPVCVRYGIAFQSHRLEMRTLLFVLMSSVWPILFVAILPLFLLSFVGSVLTKRGECSVLVGCGAVGITLQLALLVLFQSTFGILYGAIGVMVALFMAGGAVGALLAASLNPSRRNITLLLAGYGCLILFALVFTLFLRSGITGFLLFFVINALSGFLVGSVFGLIVQRIRASLAYGFDLLGAAGGTILAFFLIPTAGAVATLLLLLVPVAAGMFVLLCMRR